MWGSETEERGVGSGSGYRFRSPLAIPSAQNEKRILYVCILSVRAHWALDSGYGSQAQLD